MNPSKHQLSGYGWRPADPPRRPVLFINPRSGDGEAARAGVAEQARAKGIEAVILAPGQDPGRAGLRGRDGRRGRARDGRWRRVAGGRSCGGGRARDPVCVRPALDSGQLGIVVLDAPGDSPHSPGQAWTAPRLEVSAPAPVHAGVDGEAVDLDPPLRFAIRPTALRVRICSRHPGASPSARLRLPGYPPA